jgi:NAD(P) transhydrogenase subunit beta
MWTDLAYLLAAILFILGIKGLTSPRSAVRGNLTSAVGMLLAVVATLIVGHFNWWIIGGGIIVGALIGAVLAVRIQMTAMPQMVALLNGFGGGASVLVAGVEGARFVGLLRAMPATWTISPYPTLVATVLSGLIGAITFWGSLVAFGKLQELELFKKDLRLPAHQLLNAVLLIAAVLIAVLAVVSFNWFVLFFVLLAVVASVLGVMLVIRIGGADMPVVISLLNSYSGLAAAAAGFVIQNNVLIIAGSLVGASGIILTMIMCKAMNRSLANVLFGGIDAGQAASADDVYGGKVKSASADEIGMLLNDARRVVIVPGYGMAVSQAQFAVRDLYRDLMDRGVDVQFAIHPVAGRMPGHMNVLLAEVDIPYDRLVEMDAINPQFKEVDVAVVLGANDVVNPDARTNPKSPIAGMPILNVDEARTVIVIKRSLSPGFAGIPNPLFAADNALMFFADGKKAVLDIVAALKDA